ncbi:S1 family peptidase [Streptomyces sp. NPDC052396]|uniref:S1 family peptidase n=1 Tax=Streptomyces sp. NPDC052396 TaxID=3365689 RepID=UPI0037D5CF96
MFQAKSAVVRKLRNAAMIAGVAVALCTQNSVGAYAVSGGQLETGHRAAVFIFINSPGGYNCSGSLIGGQWVLTARHCVQWEPDGTIYPGSIYLGGGDGGYDSNTPYAYDRAVTSGDADVALYHLQNAVPAPQGGFLTLADANDAVPAVGDTETVYGWGQPWVNNVRLLHKGNAKVTGYDATNKAITYSGNDCRAGTCTLGGDSGGPVVHNFNGTEKVVAVHSYGSPYVNGASLDDRIHCTSGGVRISDVRDWIRTTSGI